MISGVFFLAGTQSLRQILRKNVLRIVTAFVFWSALLCRLSAYFFNKCALSTAVTLFFSGHYHMWFLFMIVGLYLIVPLLRPIAQNETLLRYFLLLALVFNFLLPQLGALLSLFSWPLYSSYLSLSGMLYYHFTLGFAAYFMLGRYLSRKELSAQSGPLVLCARRGRSHRHRRYDVLCLPPSGHRHRALLQLRLGRCAADVSRRLCIRPQAFEFSLTRRKGTRAHPRALPLELRRLPRASAVHRDVRSISRRQHASPATPFSPCRF